MPRQHSSKGPSDHASKGEFVTKKLTSQDTILRDAFRSNKGNFHLTPGQQKTLRRAAAA
jgi:hypothetical protein